MKYSTLIILFIFYPYHSIIIGAEIMCLEEKLILTQQKKEVNISESFSCSFTPIKIIYDMDTHEGCVGSSTYNLSYRKITAVDFLHMPSKKERIFLVKDSSLFALFRENKKLWNRYTPFALIDSVTFEGIQQAFKQRPWKMHDNYFCKSDLCCMLDGQDSDTLFILDEEILNTIMLNGDRYRSCNSDYDRRNNNNPLCTIDFRSHDNKISIFLKQLTSISLLSLFGKIFSAVIKGGSEEEVVMFQKQIKMQLLEYYFKLSCFSLISILATGTFYSYFVCPNKG